MIKKKKAEHKKLGNVTFLTFKLYNFLRNLYAYTRDLCGSKKFKIQASTLADEKRSWLYEQWYTTVSVLLGQHGKDQVCARQ